jgi:hypothetical protein
MIARPPAAGGGSSPPGTDDRRSSSPDVWQNGQFVPEDDDFQLLEVVRATAQSRQLQEATNDEIAQRERQTGLLRKFDTAILRINSLPLPFNIGRGHQNKKMLINALFTVSASQVDGNRLIRPCSPSSTAGSHAPRDGEVHARITHGVEGYPLAVLVVVGASGYSRILIFMPAGL